MLGFFGLSKNIATKKKSGKKKKLITIIAHKTHHTTGPFNWYSVECSNLWKNILYSYSTHKKNWIKSMCTFYVHRHMNNWMEKLPRLSICVFFSFSFSFQFNFIVVICNCFLSILVLTIHTCSVVRLLFDWLYSFFFNF